MRLMYKIKHISNAEYQHLFPLLLRAATFVRTDICKQINFLSRYTVFNFHKVPKTATILCRLVTIFAL